MFGSNNEVAVLEAVLESLGKSPAFALLESSHTNPSSDSLEHRVDSLSGSDF